MDILNIYIIFFPTLLPPSLSLSLSLFLSLSLPLRLSLTHTHTHKEPLYGVQFTIMTKPVKLGASLAIVLTSMSASLDAKEESCDKEEDELEPGCMLFWLPTEEAELARVWPMGRRFGLVPPDNIIWGLADTMFGENKSVFFFCVCVYIYIMNLYGNMGCCSNTKSCLIPRKSTTKLRNCLWKNGHWNQKQVSPVLFQHYLQCLFSLH